MRLAGERARGCVHACIRERGMRNRTKARGQGEENIRAVANGKDDHEEDVGDEHDVAAQELVDNDEHRVQAVHRDVDEERQLLRGRVRGVCREGAKLLGLVAYLVSKLDQMGCGASASVKTPDTRRQTR